jgi:hypothetical protein
MVELVSATQSNRQERTATSLKTIGTVTAEVTARAIDVESGVVLAQPTSRFEDSAVVTEMKTWPVPKTVGDPQVAFSNLWTKCTDTVAAEMADKLADALSHAPGPKAELPLVAGISNGSVFINQGSSSGIKKGDRFQVTRLVSTGLVDPKTQQEIKQKQQICTFVVVNADEGNSSGTCDGGTPKSGDVAEPLKP